MTLRVGRLARWLLPGLVLSAGVAVAQWPGRGGAPQQGPPVGIESPGGRFAGLDDHARLAVYLAQQLLVGQFGVQGCALRPAARQRWHRSRAASGQVGN